MIAAVIVVLVGLAVWEVKKHIREMRWIDAQYDKVEAYEAELRRDAQMAFETGYWRGYAHGRLAEREGK